MATNKCKRITFTVSIIIFTFGLTNALEKNECTTLDNVPGRCVVINDCKSMLDFLEEQDKITEKVVSVLTNHFCGFQGRSVKMCCSDKPILTTNPPLPPNVVNHKNINLLPSAMNCGAYKSANRIINGNKAMLNEFPWMTLLSYRTKKGPDFRCAGTLINEKYVLTAAHCIINLDNITLIGVRLGENNISSEKDCENVSKEEVVCAEPVQDIFIEEMIPHPNYNSTTVSNDIGLLRLIAPAQLKENVQPICLPIDEYLRNINLLNKKLIVTGWGATGTKSRRSDDLLKVGVPVIPEAECKRVYSGTQAEINYRQLCAGGKNQKDSCGGDSGGPLQLEEIIDNDIHLIQYGIVSFGHQTCGQDGFPGVYTKVNYYMDWILDNIRV